MRHNKSNVVMKQTLVWIMVCAGIFHVTLPAYIINGSTVTLTAADRTSDNTELIQGFLNNATYTKIIIQPGSNGAYWAVRPLLFSHSNTEIQLDTNTVLEALSGGYPNSLDCVLKATALSDIKVTGYPGSKILMHKEEYALLPVSEWRTALSFYSCNNVTINGLTLSNTGGDGIYLGDATGSGYCSNVIISNVTIDGAARNGLSVISIDRLNVNNCTFKNTHGLGNCAAYGPWAGIDFEPNNSSERLKNIVIDNCFFQNNGYSLILAGRELTGSSEILNITVKNCTMTNNSYYGILVNCIPASLNDNSSVVFENCNVSNCQYSGIGIGNKSKDGGRLSFTDCTLTNNCLSHNNATFYIYPGAGEIAGNIQLDNITILQPESRTVNYFLSIDGVNCQVDNVYGNIYASGGLLYTANTTNIDITALPNVTPFPPDTNLFLHNWQMDETSGNIVSDSRGSCGGITINNPDWATGRIGGSLALDGNNQLVTVTNNPSLNIGTGDFSISLWMQRNNSTVSNSRLICKGASADNNIGYVLAGSNTSLNMAISNGITRLAVPCPIPSLNQWHHFAFTVNRNNGKVKSYVDGFYQASTDISTFSGGDISNSYNLLIGAINSSGNLAWPGKVDDIRIYGRVLAPEEIAYLAENASAHWQLDDGSGTTTTDDIGRSVGMLQNNPIWTTGKVGGGLELNGVNQFVSISNNPNDLNIGTDDFSIALWMQRSNSTVTNSRLICKGASADNNIGYVLAGSNTSLNMAISNGITRLAVPCPIPSLNQWHHFAFTVNRNNGKVKSYVDGAYQSSTDISTFSGADISNSYNLLIGAIDSTGNLGWPGKIDDVRIYKRALSADEVLRLYSATP